MIFAADLDRTLLFSQRRLEGDAAVIPVEYRFGEPFGFMTPGGFSALRTLQKQAVCFVNTLRGLEQANRVVFVSKNSFCLFHFVSSFINHFWLHYRTKRSGKPLKNEKTDTGNTTKNVLKKISL